MSADYTTLGLLANMKRRGFTPAGSGLTTNDFLDILSEQLRTYIPAFLKGLREEFIVAQLNVTVTSPTVPIPVRACGAALRTIGWLCADGSVRPLTRIEPERRRDWESSGSEPVVFMFQGNNAILIPAVSSGTLVVSYQQRPGQLVLPTNCAQVTGLLPSSFLVVASHPSDLDGGVLDVVSPVPNFKLDPMDLAGSWTSGGVRFVPNVGAEIANVQIGYWLCKTGETCIPQLPYECFDLLAQAAAFQVATDTGSERLPAVTLAFERLEKQVAMVLSPRADGSARYIVNQSGIGRRRF